MENRYRALLAEIGAVHEVLRNQLAGVTSDVALAAEGLQQGIESLGALARTAAGTPSAHAEMLACELLVALQFEDVQRQRLDAVVRALDLLQARIAALDVSIADAAASSDVLDTLYAGYVMESQRAAHGAALEAARRSTDASPLF